MAVLLIASLLWSAIIRCVLCSSLTDLSEQSGVNRPDTSSKRSKPDWIEIQLTPLNPAYLSSWTGNQTETRLAVSTQVFFPPGFIGSGANSS